MLPHSLTGRLMLAALAAMLAAAVAAALAAFCLQPSPSMMAGELARHVDHIVDGVHVEPDGSIGVQLGERIANSYDAMLKDSAYRVIDGSGHAVAESSEGPALAALRSLPPEVRQFEMHNPYGNILLLVDTRRILRDGRRYTVQVARSDRLVVTLNDYERVLYLRAGLASAALALAVFCIVAFATVRRMVRPLQRASAAAADIEPRNLAARLRVDELPDELRPLVKAFNAALERLQVGYKVQQEFLAAAAHELKMPLALLRAEIELGAAPNRELLLRDTDLMARQVHQLLHLAEVSEGHNYHFSSLQPDGVAAEVVDYLARMAESKPVRLLLRAECAGAIQADPGAMFVLLKNLMENALNHSPAGGVVVLTMTPAGFSVVDEGPGIGDVDRSLLFQRFWRGSSGSSDGAGLGLAICREIVLAHGWRIDAADRADRSGAIFEVHFAGEGERPCP